MITNFVNNKCYRCCLAN